jgi:hypothetical protein
MWCMLQQILDVREDRHSVLTPFVSTHFTPIFRSFVTDFDESVRDHMVGESAYHTVLLLSRSLSAHDVDRFPFSSKQTFLQ